MHDLSVHTRWGWMCTEAPDVVPFETRRTVLLRCTLRPSGESTLASSFSLPSINHTHTYTHTLSLPYCNCLCVFAGGLRLTSPIRLVDGHLFSTTGPGWEHDRWTSANKSHPVSGWASFFRHWVRTLILSFFHHWVRTLILFFFHHWVRTLFLCFGAHCSTLYCNQMTLCLVMTNIVDCLFFVGKQWKWLIQ